MRILPNPKIKRAIALSLIVFGILADAFALLVGGSWILTLGISTLLIVVALAVLSIFFQRIKSLEWDSGNEVLGVEYRGRKPSLNIPKSKLQLDFVISSSAESTLNNRDMLIYQDDKLVERISALSGFAPTELEELAKQVNGEGETVD